MIECDKLDGKLDGITSTVNFIDGRFKTMEKRVNVIDDRLEKTEALLATVSNEMQVTATEYSTFRKEIVSRFEILKKETIQKNLDTATPAKSERVSHLEATSKSLILQFQRMKWELSYHAHSSEIVVGGVPFSEATSAKLLALAILKTNDD